MKNDTGSVLNLRSIKESDLPEITKLLNNHTIWMNLRDVIPFPYTLKDAQDWFNFVNSNAHNLCLTIEVDKVICGIISLDFKPDVYRRSAEIGYWLGEAAWGKGIATEAVRQLTKYAFQQYDLARIEARVFGWNPASKRVLEKVGYKHEGTIRNGVVKNGQITDEWVMGILREDVV
jgi:RimJ/RimL family protein N-acetyltransferase